MYSCWCCTLTWPQCKAQTATDTRPVGWHQALSSIHSMIHLYKWQRMCGRLTGVYAPLPKPISDYSVLPPHRYLRMLTFLPLEQIAELEQQMQGGSYKPNTAQELLAREVLTFVHGEQGLQAALQATQVGWRPTKSCILQLQGRHSTNRSCWHRAFCRLWVGLRSCTRPV